MRADKTFKAPSQNLPSFAESHGCKPVDECEVGTLRSLGEGGYASEGSALRSVWRDATAVRPWGLHMMWITRHHESGNPSHGRSVLDCLRSRQEQFRIVSPESPLPE